MQSCGGVYPGPILQCPALTDPIFGYSVPLAALGWTAFGLVVLKGHVSDQRNMRSSSVSPA